ncbi:choice-of-anchor L domain-containing protein [Flavobacterium sp. KACC 22761]|uniref:T9SS type B sorting domain-containing protein n=1 Tax=Flavobacterium sp. KACC 22761 TaxID=3092665 RepID=UPI002A75FC35|nr:choice-of-anchor L domain-containing protein [Flavobacterium sp. KACC 22761]WPO79018.1 choice-of-anchor L domain-containing protein [Flavobacterium sp. KACC 22761]
MNAQYITIDDQRTPKQLIENVLINSSCLSVSNISGKGNPDIFHYSYDYFNAGTSDFPFPEGIVLSTSTAFGIPGPYTSTMGGGNPLLWFGDADLDQILGIHSTNATSLEFDFVALTNFINFNYIFASNEYQFDFACSYSDGFAFLIKEAGASDPYQNIAVIPGTNIPVSSVDIRPTIVPGKSRNGDPYSGCPEKNPKYFDRLLTPVTTGTPTAGAIDFAGQTVIMNAQANVTIGKKYHIKLVIGDDRNQYYDSAVFLQAGSFTSQINLGPDQTAANGNPVCFGRTVTLDTKLSSSYSFKWFKDNVEIVGATYPSYDATETGNYKVEVVMSPSTCAVMGQIKLEFAPEILYTNTLLLQCDDNTDGISIFNLNKANNLVNNNVATSTTEGYYLTLTDAQNKTNKIQNQGNYINTTNNQIVYARIENQFGCFKVAEVTLQITNTSIANPSPIATCDLDNIQDGLYQFDLNSEVTPKILIGLPAGLTATYYLTSNDAVTETNPVPNVFKNTTPYNQTLYARVVNGPDCHDIVPVTLVVNTFDPPNFEDESKYICKDGDVTLSVATGFSGYAWTPGNSTSNSMTANAPGDYSVTVTDANGCQKTKNFKVISSEPATITEVVVKDFSGVDNSVLIKYTGSGNYEFSLDGTVFQDDPQFTGVAPGAYYAIAKDKNGCGPSNRFLFYVLDYPKFFTPNGDGYNDLWTIKSVGQMPDYTISIFDRYGKFLKQLNQNSPGWNGIFNGEQLPSDDYWFTLIFVDGKSVKGHFSLKR